MLTALAITAFPIQATSNVQAATLLSKSEAKQIIKKKIPNASLISFAYDTEDGKKVYEAELIKGKKEYSIALDAYSGAVIEYEWEKEPTSYKQQSKNTITKKQARALAKAKVSNAKIQKLHLEEEDGIMVYEIKMKKGKRRYELVIDAKTKTLLQYQWKK